MSKKIKLHELASIIKQEITNVLNEKLTKRYLSDTFSLDKIRKNNPELASAIQKMSRLSVEQLTTSSLLFDGSKLHWRVGKQNVFSWAASSGHYEDSIIPFNEPENFPSTHTMEDIINTLKILKNTDIDKNTKKQELYKIFGTITKETDTETVRTIKGDYKVINANVNKVMKVTDEIDKVRDLYARASEDDVRDQLTDDFVRLNRKLKDLVMFFMDKKTGDMQTEPEQRRKQSGEKNEGPIPEGAYMLASRLQDMSNTSKLTFPHMLYMGLHLIKKNTEDNEKFARDSMKFLSQNFPNIKNPERLRFDAGNTDWGDFRINIFPADSRTIRKRNILKNVRKGKGYEYRNRFYIHGGDLRGSSGCIDLGNSMNSFAKFWVLGGVGRIMGKVRKAGKSLPHVAKPNTVVRIPLIVRYETSVKNKLISNNPAAKEQQNVVFDKPTQ